MSGYPDYRTNAGVKHTCFLRHVVKQLRHKETGMSLVQPVLKGLNEDLPYDLIIDLLKDCDEETASNLPPVRPKAGDVYVFAPLKEECKSERF